MEYIPLIISLISGAVGGNIIGAIKKLSLGPIGNSIVGILGGGIGSQILGNLLGLSTGDPAAGEAAAGAAAAGMDINSILSNVASGGVGGGVLMVIVGLLKSLFAK